MQYFDLLQLAFNVYWSKLRFMSVTQIFNQVSNKIQVISPKRLNLFEMKESEVLGSKFVDLKSSHLLTISSYTYHVLFCYATARPVYGNLSLLSKRPKRKFKTITDTLLFNTAFNITSGQEIVIQSLIFLIRYF